MNYVLVKKKITNKDIKKNCESTYNMLLNSNIKLGRESYLLLYMKSENK